MFDEYVPSIGVIVVIEADCLRETLRPINKISQPKISWLKYSVKIISLLTYLVHIIHRTYAGRRKVGGDILPGQFLIVIISDFECVA